VTTSAAFTVLGANLLVAGGGYTSSLAQPELVFPSPVTQVVAGIDGSSFWYMVVLQNGTVWTKGANSVGQLGDGTQTNRATWAPVAGISTATKIAAGGRTAYALLSNGTVRAWGNGSSGALGNGGTTGSNSATPVTVSNVSGATQIAAAAAAGYALLSNGTVMAWGHNNNGQQGNGTIGGSQVSAVAIPALSGVTQICAGDYSAYALLSNGQIRAWGDNQYGQLGDGSNTTSGTPVNVSGVIGAKMIAAAGNSAYALFTIGGLRAWGRNKYGQLGNGDTTDHNTHVGVSGIESDATQIGAGSRTAYAMWSSSAGSNDVQAWGANASGQLGNASTSDSSTPVHTTSLQGQSISALPATSLGSTLLLVTKV
jgi:alpha-tubulin suppressor-like RCC1 family protein